MKLLRVALALTIAVLVEGSASAEDSSLKTTLTSRYAAMKAAMAAHDSTAIKAILAPDFTSVDVNGAAEQADDMIRGVAGLKNDPNKVSNTTVLTLNQNGSMLSVRQRYDMKTVKQATDGTKQNVELIAVSDDTWVQSGGAWLLKRTETKQMDYFVNGASVIHKIATTP